MKPNVVAAAKAWASMPGRWKIINYLDAIAYVMYLEAGRAPCRKLARRLREDREALRAAIILLRAASARHGRKR